MRCLLRTVTRLPASPRPRYGSGLIHHSWKISATFARTCATHCDGQRNGWSVTSTSTSTSTTSKPPTPPADHRQISVEQDLFLTSEYSPGSPIFLPNGAFIFNKLCEFMRNQLVNFGFQEVITPLIYKKSLWERSGHWALYAEDMYAVTGRSASKDGDLESGKDNEAGSEEYGLKPMNCPGHCLIFSSKLRSYRDLPLRYADHSSLHRNEISGALSGLTRVRRFHQDDGHIFCRPMQIQEEIARCLQFINVTYKCLGLGPFRLALSTRPLNGSIGSEVEWENAETALKSALEASGQAWIIQEGDGAFYGPKIDVILTDSDGKQHQTATIQLDFQLPRRFNLEYQAPAPQVEQRGETTSDPELLAKQGPVAPVMIHRAVFGSVERMMALLTEHHNGRWPFWLNPRPVTIITTSDEASVVQKAHEVRHALCDTTPWESMADASVSSDAHLLRPYSPMGQVYVDASPRSVGKKIQEAKQQRSPVVIVVGPRELTSETLKVDIRGLGAAPAQPGLEKYLRGVNVKDHGGVEMSVDTLKSFLLDMYRLYV